MEPEGDGAEYRYGSATSSGSWAPWRIMEDAIVLWELGERGDGRGHCVAPANGGAGGGGPVEEVGREDTRRHPA